MKFNTLVKYSLSGVAMVMAVACDDVKPDDRYILGEEIKSEGSVLLEDFTGQRCLNCPDAHEVIKELEAQYGSDKVIAVSIHCGSFGFSKHQTNFEKGNVGLMTEEGNAILETYSISSFPMGCVDMGSPITYGLWASAVRDALAKPSHVNIDLDVEFTPSDTEANTGTIEIKAEVMSGETHTGNIQFWILEDNIIAPQRHGNQTIYEYVHDNVFRAQVFDGVRGESITLPEGLSVTKQGSIKTRWNNEEHWEVDNLSVVAFVCDANGVLQVVKKPVIAKSTSPEE